jgi:hypothetical protein
MAGILSFPQDEPVFEPELTQAMSVAFEEVCRDLDLPPDANGAREVIAARILELARRGENDPARLRERVLAEASGGRGSARMAGQP